jgi:hypothetical protein
VEEVPFALPDNLNSRFDSVPVGNVNRDIPERVVVVSSVVMPAAARLYAPAVACSAAWSAKGWHRSAR